MSARRMAAVAVLTLAGAGRGFAGPEVTEGLGGSVNLPGVQNTLEATWKRGAAQYGVAHSVSPAFTRVGAWAQWSPGPMLELRAGVEPSLHHGSSSLLGFTSRDAAFDEETRRQRHDASVQASGRACVAPTLRARLGPIVASGTAEVERWYASSAEAFFYEPSRDTLLRAGGDTLLRGSAAVLYEVRGRGGRVVRVGGNYRLATVRDAPASRVERAGVLAQWTLGDRALGLREPTAVVNVFRYLDDPYKKGEIGLSLGLRCRLR